MGERRWEMGDGRWEMGDGRWEMGDGAQSAIFELQSPSFLQKRRSGEGGFTSYAGRDHFAKHLHDFLDLDGCEFRKHGQRKKL